MVVGPRAGRRPPPPNISEVPPRGGRVAAIYRWVASSKAGLNVQSVVPVSDRTDRRPLMLLRDIVHPSRLPRSDRGRDNASTLISLLLPPHLHPPITCPPGRSGDDPDLGHARARSFKSSQTEQVSRTGPSPKGGRLPCSAHRNGCFVRSCSALFVHPRRVS
jgi:hypothetical protein